MRGGLLCQSLSINVHAATSLITLCSACCAVLGSFSSICQEATIDGAPKGEEEALLKSLA